MPKITIQLVVYNSRKYLSQVFESVFAQTEKDFEVIAVICGNADGGKEFIEQNYPSVKIIDPGKNLGFGGGHNLALSSSKGEFIQIIGNDLILDPQFLTEMLLPFGDADVAAVSGKLYQMDFEKNEKKQILDSTGIDIYQSGRARDRGQHELDSGQYDAKVDIVGVSGAAPMYRKSALNIVSLPATLATRDSQLATSMYFDPDFFMYWEDVDLSLRLKHAGYKIRFAPKAIGYHGRGSGSSKEGVKKFGSFLNHRSTQAQITKNWNFTNHLYMIIKNYPKLHFSFFKREFLMLGFIIILETRTLAVMPEFIKNLPATFKKRKEILSKSKLSVQEFENYFVKDGNNLS